MTDNHTSTQTLTSATIQLLRPLVRILVRNGISYGTFADLVKWLFVDVVRREFSLKGRKQTISRVSVITGLTRKEVKRQFESDQHQGGANDKKDNRAARVISGWLRDDDFLDENGSPAILPVAGNGATFTELVRRFSGDMPPRTVLDELLRVGGIERVKSNHVRLLARGFIPLRDDPVQHNILGRDVSLLISTIDHNLRSNSAPPYFQRKVSYDNLPDEALPDFKKNSFEAAQRFLEKLDRWLAHYDRDVNPTIEGSGRNTAGMGIYYFEERYGKRGEK